MNADRAFDIIISTKIIAISRGLYGEDLMMAAKALFKGGVRAFEIAFEHDKPVGQMAESIGKLADMFGADACVGAGTILTLNQLEVAYHAGASFIISPNVNPEIIEETVRLGLISVPGAMTPTEIEYAYGLGADIVKVFPAGVLGIDYFKAVRAPLSHIPMAAVAGITAENIGAFNSAGASAFGISSSLFVKDAIRSKRFDILTATAEEFFRNMCE